MDLGNAMLGKYRGKCKIHFPDGSMIEYEVPFMKLSGLLFGKRVLQFIGNVIFMDTKNRIEANLDFAKEAGMFRKQMVPLDHFSGTLTVNEKVVHKIEGSWLSHLQFDNEVYWELEKTEAYFPVALSKCLPSNCQIRDDSKAFQTGDMKLA